MRHIHKGDRWGASCVPPTLHRNKNKSNLCSCSLFSKRDGAQEDLGWGWLFSLVQRSLGAHVQPQAREKEQTDSVPPCFSAQKDTQKMSAKVFGGCGKNMGVVLRIGTVPKRYTLRFNPVIAGYGCWEPGMGPRGLLQRRAVKEEPASYHSV